MTDEVRPVRLGIIGGSGLYQIDGLKDAEWVSVASPFGEPSDQVLLGNLEGLDVAFLPRHGRGHRIPPGKINFRANIDVLKRCGVTDIVSLSAVGSLRAGLAPGDFVVVAGVGNTVRYQCCARRDLYSHGGAAVFHPGRI